MIPSIIRSYNINKNIKFEVFVHKVDGLNEESKIETHRKVGIHDNVNLYLPL